MPSIFETHYFFPSFKIFVKLLLLTAIGPPFEDNKPAIEAEAIQDGRGGCGIEDFAPMGGDEVSGDDSRSDFGAFGDDLEDAICLFFSGEHITQLIQTEKRHF